MGMTMTAIPPPTCHVPSCLMFMVDGSYASCHPLSSPFLWWMENKRPRNFVVVTSFWPPYSTTIASSFVGRWGRSHEIVMTSTQFSYWGINLVCERKGQRLDNLGTHCISFVERKRNSVKLVETGTFFWSCPCVYFILSLESFSLVHSRNIPSDVLDVLPSWNFFNDVSSRFDFFHCWNFFSPVFLFVVALFVIIKLYNELVHWIIF